jgi:hypothetical protein
MRPRSRARRAFRLPRLILSRSLIQLAASLLETHGRVRSQKPPRTTAQPLPEPARSQKPPRTTVQPLPSQKRPLNRFGNALACLVAGVSSGVSSATVTSSGVKSQRVGDSSIAWIGVAVHIGDSLLVRVYELEPLGIASTVQGGGKRRNIAIPDRSAPGCVAWFVCKIRLQTSPSRVNQLIQENTSSECPKRPTASSLL